MFITIPESIFRVKDVLDAVMFKNNVYVISFIYSYILIVHSKGHWETHWVVFRWMCSEDRTKIQELSLYPTS